MKKLIVDTNIVFSAILNTDSKIAKILLQPNHVFTFYSCDFLRQEISTHRKKILQLTRYGDTELDEVEYLVTKNIHFLNHLTVEKRHLERAKRLCENIDTKDYPFIALCLHYKGSLWTGDKKLYTGLQRKGFTKLYLTHDLLRQ